MEGHWISYTNGDNVKDFRKLMDKMFFNREEIDVMAWDLELITKFIKSVVDTDGAIGLLYMYEKGEYNPLTYRALTHNVPRNKLLKFAV